MRKQSFPLIGIAALLGVASAPRIAQAQGPYGQLPNLPTAFAMATAGEDNGNGTGLLSDNNVLQADNSLTVINAGPVASANVGPYTVVPGNTGTARANATFGTIRLFAESHDGVNTGFVDHAGAIADVGWLDGITISNDALTGQNGILNFSIFTEGSLFAGDPTGSASAVIGVAHGFGQHLSVRSFGGQANSVPGNFSLNVSENTNFSLPFTFGSSFTIMVRGVARAGLSGRPPQGAGSSGLADFENTIYWSGVQGVTTQGGAPVSAFTMTSASGTNYLQSLAPSSAAAPEPGTFALLGSALGLLVGVRSHRRPGKRGSRGR